MTLASGLLVLPTFARTQTQEKLPPLKAELVKEFVVAGHNNLERVQEMLASEPGLLNATWDWKAGDFETALGGAGHMGRKDIANYLLEQGARLDIFVATMLGKLEIVKAMLAAYPNLLNSKGPHGITLLKHALAGKEEAAPMVEYLNGLLGERALK
ncbi:MAG: ankyrin repeat domain-containing protein [candidate division KSB1 bacterium]